MVRSSRLGVNMCFYTSARRYLTRKYVCRDRPGSTILWRGGVTKNSTAWKTVLSSAERCCDSGQWSSVLALRPQDHPPVVERNYREEGSFHVMPNHNAVEFLGPVMKTDARSRVKSGPLSREGRRGNCWNRTHMNHLYCLLNLLKNNTLFLVYCQCLCAGREFRSLHDQYPNWIIYFVPHKLSQSGFDSRYGFSTPYSLHKKPYAR